MAEQDQEKMKQDLGTIRAVYESGSAEINGNKYEFTKMKHKQRRKVFSFYTAVTRQIKVGDFSFLEYESFESVEKIIEDAVLFDGVQLSKRPDHWDKHANDYIKFIMLAVSVISYPFFDESGGS